MIFFRTRSSLVSRWCMCTVMTVSRFVRCSFVRSVLVVSTIMSFSRPSTFFIVLDMIVLSVLALARPACMDAVHMNWKPRRPTCAGCERRKSSIDWS